MRAKTLWLAAALVAAALVCTGEPSDAQPPGKKKGPPDGFGKKDGFKKDGEGFKGKGKGKGGFGPARSLTGDDIVDYLLAFDKEKSGKVTAAQLPERMQPLVAQGDSNKDGALDREEIVALADKLGQQRPFPGFGGFGGKKGRGPGDGPGGFGPKGPKGFGKGKFDKN